MAAAVASDVLAVLVTFGAGLLLGTTQLVPHFEGVTPGPGIVAAVLLLGSLFGCRAWDPRILGSGAEEFSRAIRAVVTTAVLIGLLALALAATAARPWVFGLIPLAGLLLVAGRLLLRRHLYRLRANGRCVVPVLAVGDFDSVTDLVDRTRRDVGRGWVISGICTPTGAAPNGSAYMLGIPVVGDLDDVAAVARAGRHRVVAVCPTPGWTPRRLQGLAWSLDDQAAELVVDPGLMEVAGPRLHIDPVDGLPLLRLTRPTFTGLSWLAKLVLDRLCSFVMLLILSPLLLVLAIGVKLDGGPVFFRQTRIGRHGREFTIIKFRSMVVDAEQRLAELQLVNEGTGPLFKVRDDPRITQVGAFLRRYSLDELPQLFNVMSGSMSLVGPRPPLPSEVATYGADAQRRLLVRPGLTGLWQVSGRSDLSWKQSVRLDLRYVENWSFALDALIICKTFGAVIKRRGAY